MDGDEQLRQLADLWRIGAETTEKLGELRPSDAAALNQIAQEALVLAWRLDVIADKKRNGHHPAKP